MDLNKLKSLIADKQMAIDLQDGCVRVNLEIGNDNSWMEFEINNQNEKRMASIINKYVSKIKSKK